MSRLGLLWRTHSGKELTRRGVPRARSMRIDPAVVVAALLVNLLGLAMPLAVLQIYDRIAPSQAYETLFALTFCLIAVGFIEFGLRISQGYLSNLSSGRFSHALQVLALRRLLASKAERRETLHPTQTLEQIKAIDRLTAYYGGHPRLALIDLPFSFLFIGMIAIIAGPLAFAPVIVVAVFLGHVVRLGRRNRAVAEARDEQDGRTVDFLGEVLSGGFTVKSFSIEILMLRRFERLLKRSAGLQKQSVELANDLQRASAVFGNASMVTMISVGALCVIYGDLSIGGLAACSLLSGRAAQPLLKAANAWNELERATIALDKVSELFRLPPQEVASADVPAASQRAPRVVGRELSLTRGERSLLEKVDFEIGPGEATALLGPDGCGRSSLLWAMAGTLTPRHGSVLVDDVEAATHRRRKGAGVVFYSPNLRPFNGTILQNITLFGRGAGVEEARWAAQLFGVEAAINVLPEGYDTMLGASVAETLPSGLVRRIMLARAVAQQPRLLLLDSPTAFLDESAETALFKAIEALRGHVTMVISGNNRALVERMDQVLIFENGGLISESPVAALAALDGRRRGGAAPAPAAAEGSGGAA